MAFRPMLMGGALLAVAFAGCTADEGLAVVTFHGEGGGTDMRAAECPDGLGTLKATWKGDAGFLVVKVTQDGEADDPVLHNQTYYPNYLEQEESVLVSGAPVYDEWTLAVTRTADFHGKFTFKLDCD